MPKCPECHTKNKRSASYCSFCGTEMPPPKTLQMLYKQYKAQNKLPFFMMLIFGFATILLGLGFLGHYAFEYYIGSIPPVVKIIAGFSLSLTAVILGVFFIRKKQKIERGLLLLSSGILGNYILTYLLAFIEGYPQISSGVAGLTLVIVNTLLGSIFSLSYKDRILAILTLLGGAFTPFFIDIQILSAYYLVFLFALTLISVYITEIIEWKNFGIMTFGVVTGIVQYTVLKAGQGALLPVHLMLFHAFTYVFMYLGLFELKPSEGSHKRLLIILEEKLLKKAKSRVKPVDLIIVLITFAFFLFNLFNYFAPAQRYYELGGLLFLNSLPYIIGLIIYEKELQNQIKQLFLLFAATLFALGLPAVVPLEYVGVSWAFEALLILLFGFHFRIKRLRNIAHAFLLVSLLMMLYSLKDLIIFWQIYLFNSGFINLLFIGFILFGYQAIIYYFENKAATLELKIYTFGKEFTSFWLVIIYTIIVIHSNVLFLLFGLFSMFLAYLYIFRAHTQRLIFTGILGYLMYLLSVGFCLYVVSVRLPADVQSDFFSYGYFNLLLAGFQLYSFKYWFIYVQSYERTPQQITLRSVALHFSVRRYEDLDFSDNRLVLIFDKLFQLWATFAYILTIIHLAPGFLAAFSLVPVFIFLYLGYSRNLVFERLLGYGLYFFFFLYALLRALQEIPIEMAENMLGFGFFNLLQAGMFIIGIWVFFYRMQRIEKVEALVRIDEKIVEQSSRNLLRIAMSNLKTATHFWASREYAELTVDSELKTYNNKYKSFIINAFSVWISLTTVYTLLFFSGTWAFNILIVLMFGLIYLGGKKDLFFTEFLGFFIYGFMLFGAFVSIVSVDFHLFQLDIAGKLLVIENYVILWLLKSFYQAFFPNNKRLGLMHQARILFYILLPFALLFIVYRKLFDFLPYGVWAAVAIAFVTTEASKNRFLRSEFYFLIALASLLNFAISNFYALFTGLALLLLIKFSKRITRRYQWGFWRYRLLIIYLYYYTGSLLYYGYTWLIPGDRTTAVFMTTAYFLALMNSRKKIIPIRISYLFAYRIAYILLSIGLFLFVSNDMTITNFNLHGYKMVSVIFMLLSFYLLHRLIYQQHTQYPGSYLSDRWKFELRVLHLYYLIGYNTLIYFFTANWGSLWLTFAMIFHGIIILFNSIKPKYKVLLNESVLIFAAALFKLLLFDRQQLSLIMFVIVLMILGAIFVGSALLFNYWKRKSDAKTTA